MNIIIVGCGKVGRTLVEELSKEENDIMVIDLKQDIVEKVVSEYDVAGIVGNAANHSTLVEAGIEKCDLMIAVTNSDDFNIVCCLFAKKAGGCQTIARVRNPEYNREIKYIREELGLAMVINPEMIAALEISRVLRFPSAIIVETFAKGRIEMLKFRIPEDSVLNNLKVDDMHLKLKTDVLICAVERENEIFIPKGGFELKSKDIITIVASHKYLGDFFSKIGVRTNHAKSIIIAGGGEVAFYLASILSGMGVKVKIIEAKPEKCYDLCDQLDKTKIVNGDATDKNLLLEEGITRVDAFAALTNLDEENVMLSLYAKKVSQRIKTITKINKIEFDDILKEMDLDTLIYPKKVAAEYIVRFVRAMKNTVGSNVETMYRILADKAEALEFIVREESEVTNIPLVELKIKENILVACIIRINDIIYPKGNDEIKVGDSVIIITVNDGVNGIEDIIQK